MQKKKIAFFIDSLGFGGAERSLVSLLQNLDYERLDVDLYAWNKDGAFVRFKPQQVDMYTIPVPKGGLGRLRFRIGQYKYSFLIRVVPKLGLKRHQAELLWRSIGPALPQVDKVYDVAISYQQGFMTYYVADKVRARRKIAWINSQLSGHYHKVKFSRSFYDRYDDVVCVSQLLYEILPRDGYVDASKLTTIYDILNANTVRAMAEEPIVLQRKSKWLITTVARIAEYKNLPLAVKTAELLCDRGLDFEWLIVGDGPQHAYIQQMIDGSRASDRMHMLGFKVNPYPYIKAADLYVQTSTFEGFGLTITEAKMLNKPVVSTNFSVVYDQITDGVNGLIAEMTPESVADRIMRLVTDADLRQGIIAAVESEVNDTATTEVQKFYRLIQMSESTGPQNQR